MSFWDTVVGKGLTGIGRGLGVVGPEKIEAQAVDTSQADAARAKQDAFITALQAQAAGVGPSAAQAQLQQATDANIQQAMAMGQAQAGQGLGYQAALKGIGSAQARAQQESAGQSAVVRAQEQQRANELLGGALGNQRSGDLNQAGLKQQNAYAYDALNSGNTERSTDRLNKTVTGAMNSLGGGMAMDDGGAIPGAAPVPGDSPRNDVVPAMLSPGEIVLPRTVAQSDDAPDKAAEFVAAIKSSKTKKTGGDYGAVMSKLAQIEKMLSKGAA